MATQASTTRTKDHTGTDLRFEDHYTAAVQDLRTELIRAYQSVGADSQSPREAARTIGIDKTLAWKLGRIINEESIERVASSIPGAAAVLLTADAFTKAGVPDPIVRGVQDAFREFDRMVEVHTGDREALDLLLDSMAFSGADRLVKSRKLAFRGNSGIWGAQARLRLLTSFLSPSARDPGMLDYAQVGGYVELQRLRRHGAWPLFRFREFNDDGSTIGTPGISPLVDNPEPGTPHLLNQFSTGRAPEIIAKEINDGLLYELVGGPVGKTGVCSTYSGYSDLASLTRYRDAHNGVGEVLCLINLPIETLVMDLLVHRSFAEQIKPEVVVYGRASGELDEHERRDQRSLLPISESLRFLGMNPMLALTQVPEYTELTALAFARCGFDAEDFVAWRLLIPYPPMTSTVSIRFDLPEK